MDNALLALYVWFSLALLFTGCVGSMGDVPARVSELRMTLVFALHAALSLGLSAHIAWRRLRWVPVEGEVVEVRGGGPCSASWSFGWRWAYGGVTHTAADVIGEWFVRFALLFNRIGRGTRATLWVDPRDPSRLLPSTWGLRLFSYLIFGGVSAYFILDSLGVVP